VSHERIDRILEILDAGNQSTTPFHHGYPPASPDIDSAEALAAFLRAFAEAAIKWQAMYVEFAQDMAALVQAFIAVGEHLGQGPDVDSGTGDEAETIHEGGCRG
jgi:hypothetical protein